MKKNLFFMLFSLLCNSIFAQKTNYNYKLFQTKAPNVQAQSDFQNFYFQDFADSTLAASSMTFVDKDGLTPHFPGMETWIISSHGYALSSSYLTDGNKTADDWMITPKITVGNRVYISWDAHSYDPDYADGYEVLVSTTGTTIPNNFAKVYSIAAENSEWTHHELNISDLTAGKDIYVAFRNHSTDKYALAVDNIKVYDPYNLELAVNKLFLDEFYQTTGDEVLDLNFEVRNNGADTINSIRAIWQVGDHAEQSQTISGLTIPIGQTQKITLHQVLNLAHGSNHIQVRVDSINGQIDEDLNNNKAEYYSTLLSTSESASRLVLLEHFTQASCAPCAQQNPYLNSLITKAGNNERVAHIAYHTSWPGNDPMYDFNKTACAQRVSYYGVSGVPDVIMAGNYQESSPSGITQTNIDNEVNRIAEFGYDSVSVQKNADTLAFTVYLKAYADILNSDTVYLRTVLVEHKVYSTAPGTNGEKNFPDVMRKMFPDPTGEKIGHAKKGQSFSFSYNYIVPSNINIDSCHIVSFVQNDDSKEVYGVTKVSFPVLRDTTSAISSNQNIKVALYPNPAKDFIIIQSPVYMQSILVFNVSGQTLWKQNFGKGIKKIYFEVNDLPAGLYTVRLNTTQGNTFRKFMVR